MKTPLLWAALAPCFLLLPPAANAAGSPREVTTRIERVALFKNGLGFFIRSGNLPDQSGPIQIGPLPVASHGTFWLSWPGAVKLTDLAASEARTFEWREAVTIPELLQGNVGKRVRLEFGSEFRPSLEGVLKSYPQPPDREPPNPYLADVIPLPPQPQGQLLTIQTAGGLVALNPNSVDRITFLEDPSALVPIPVKKVSLTGELTEAAANQGLTVSYLAKGMTWAPSYIVDISAPREALLTAKAEIINDIEDLDEAHVDLVTGFPYLEFADVVSPLAKKGDLTAFLNALGRGYSPGREDRYRGAALQQVAYNVMGPAGPAGPAGPGPTPEYGAATAGVSAEDLFLYPVEKVTLKRNQVGYYPLFTEKVPYEHVYEWEIPDYVNEQDQYQRPPETQKPAEIVWHSLRLKNTTKLPWTTAPAETMKDNQILGQATLTYTAPGNDVMLKITQALGIKAQETELETNREVNALQRYGWSYDRITVEGTLLLHNFTAGAVAVKITKTLSGEVVTSAPEAQVVKLAKGLRQENPRSKLTWEVPLNPGAEAQVTYTYKVLIRR